MAAVDEPPRRRRATPDGRVGRRRSRVPRPRSSPTRSASYLRASARRGSAAGESGVLPVIAGLFLISILFQSLNSNFLTAGNLVNLLVQGAVFMLLAMGEVFALLLGEIDLSIGFVAGIGGVITAELVDGADGWPWWAAILAALVACAAIGAAPGHDHHPARPAVVRRHARRPARLAGRDAADPRQRRARSRSTTTSINDIASGNLTPAASWIVMLVLVARVRR